MHRLIWKSKAADLRILLTKAHILRILLRRLSCMEFLLEKRRSRSLACVISIAVVSSQMLSSIHRRVWKLLKTLYAPLDRNELWHQDTAFRSLRQLGILLKPCHLLELQPGPLSGTPFAFAATNHICSAMSAVELWSIIKSTVPAVLLGLCITSPLPKRTRTQTAETTLLDQKHCNRRNRDRESNMML